jgi:AcrR family transcriptional regulator
VQRSKAVIEDAFVRLVCENGYHQVSVEDVAEAADVGKATFYRHYGSKEALLAALSERLVHDLANRTDNGQAPLPAGEYASVSAAYQQAAELRELYQVCLADARARAAYTEAFARHSEEQFRQGLDALGHEPRIPPTVMATFFAGAHVLLLERWLNGATPHTGDELASMELALFVAGAAWATRMTVDESSSPEIVAALKRHDGA